MSRISPLKKYRELILAYFESYPPPNCQTAVLQIEGLVEHRYSQEYIRRFLLKEGIACNKQRSKAKRPPLKERILTDLLPQATKELEMIARISFYKMISHCENRFDSQITLFRHLIIGYLLSSKKYSPLLLQLVVPAIETLRKELYPVIADLMNPPIIHYALLETVPAPYFHSFREYGYAAERDPSIKQSDYISSPDEELLQLWITRNQGKAFANMLRTAFSSNVMIAALTDATLIATALPIAVSLTQQISKIIESEIDPKKEKPPG